MQPRRARIAGVAFTMLHLDSQSSSPVAPHRTALT